MENFVIFNVSVCFLSFGVFLMFCCVVLDCLKCFGIHVMNVRLLMLLCFETLGGHNSRKCIIFKVHDGQKLAIWNLEQPLCTYYMFPSIFDEHLWWILLLIWWLNVGVEWLYPPFHLALLSSSLLVPSYAFNGPFRWTSNWKNMGYLIKFVFGHEHVAFARNSHYAKTWQIWLHPWLCL